MREKGKEVREGRVSWMGQKEKVVTMVVVPSENTRSTQSIADH